MTVDVKTRNRLSHDGGMSILTSDPIQQSFKPRTSKKFVLFPSKVGIDEKHSFAVGDVGFNRQLRDTQHVVKSTDNDSSLLLQVQQKPKCKAQMINSPLKTAPLASNIGHADTTTNRSIMPSSSQHKGSELPPVPLVTSTVASVENLGLKSGRH
jgi:hypothetical protein